MTPDPIAPRTVDMARAWAAKELGSPEVEVRRPEETAEGRLRELHDRRGDASKYDYVIVRDPATGKDHFLRVGDEGNVSRNMARAREHGAGAIPGYGTYVNIKRLEQGITDSSQKWFLWGLLKLGAWLGGPVALAAVHLPELVMSFRSLIHANLERRHVVKVVDMHV